MIRNDKIKEVAQGLVGWRQPTKSGFGIVDSANQASRSSLYYQDANGLITIENIKATINDDKISDADFNERLRELSEAGFIDLAKKLFNEEDFIENNQLFNHENTWTNSLENEGDFVGYEIDLCKNEQQLLAKINQVTLDFDAAGTFNLLLFHSSKRQPIKSIEVTVEEDNSVTVPLDWILDQSGEFKSGNYYIGYLTTGLTPKAINRRYQLANIQSNFKSFKIRPFRIVGWNTETLFDIDKIDYTADTYGLNFNISCYDDYTQFILQNQDRFAYGLQLSVAINAIKIMANSTRSNRNERLGKNSAIFEIDGNRNNPNLPEHTGLSNELTAEIKRLMSSFVEVSPVTTRQL